MRTSSPPTCGEGLGVGVRIILWHCAGCSISLTPTPPALAAFGLAGFGASHVSRPVLRAPTRGRVQALRAFPKNKKRPPELPLIAGDGARLCEKPTIWLFEALSWSVIVSAEP